MTRWLVTAGIALAPSAAVGTAAATAGVLDTDGDGVSPLAELDAGTDPLASDSDGDGLTDGDETTNGTDPRAPDTDGDTLRDGAEVDQRTASGVPLPGADPLAMDIYVVVGVAEGSTGLADYGPIERAFADMPVENPDGTSGIDVHVVEERSVERRVRFDGENFDDIERDHLSRLSTSGLDPRHRVMFVSFVTSEYEGWGDIGGRDSIVDGAESKSLERSMVVHELLHNVVGQIQDDGRCPDDPHHYCAGGWLEPDIDGSGDRYLPEALADEIEEAGFRSR